MKKLAYLFGLMMVLTIGFTSCEKDGDDDPIVNPAKNTEWYGVWMATTVKVGTDDPTPVAVNYAYEFKSNNVVIKYADYTQYPNTSSVTFKSWDVDGKYLIITKNDGVDLEYNVVTTPTKPTSHVGDEIKVEFTPNQVTTLVKQ